MPDWVLLVTAAAYGLGAAALICWAMWAEHRERQAVRERLWPWWPYDGPDR